MKKPPTKTGMQAALVDVDTLAELPGNPKAHAIQDIDQSVTTFGFIERIVINRITGHILSGHGRTETLRVMRAAGKEPPGNVEIKGDRWLVPVDYVDVPEMPVRRGARFGCDGKEWDIAHLVKQLEGRAVIQQMANGLLLKALERR